MTTLYSDSKDFLNKIVTVKIDRPLGSEHPHHGFVYPVNYGFVPGTTAPDGEMLDAYVLGICDPIAEFQGRCIAVIHRTHDADDKLIVVSDGSDYSDEQIRASTDFVEQNFESVIIRYQATSRIL
jgi:inorganic pyrophosphatase